MDPSSMRQQLLQLVVDESLAIAKYYYPNTQADSYVFFLVLACLCKYVNVKLSLDRTSKIDSKDFGDDEIAEALHLASPVLDQLYDSDGSSKEPMPLLPIDEYPFAIKDGDILSRLSYALVVLLDRIYPKLLIKPTKPFNYTMAYFQLAEFTNSFHSTIFGFGPVTQPELAPYSPPPAKSSTRKAEYPLQTGKDVLKDFWSNCKTVLKVLLAIIIIVAVLSALLRYKPSSQNHPYTSYMTESPAPTSTPDRSPFKFR